MYDTVYAGKLLGSCAAEYETQVDADLACHVVAHAVSHASCAGHQFISPMQQVCDDPVNKHAMHTQPAPLAHLFIAGALSRVNSSMRACHARMPCTHACHAAPNDPGHARPASTLGRHHVDCRHARIDPCITLCSHSSRAPAGRSSGRGTGGTPWGAPCGAHCMMRMSQLIRLQPSVWTQPAALWWHSTKVITVLYSACQRVMHICVSGMARGAVRCFIVCV